MKRVKTEEAAQPEVVPPAKAWRQDDIDEAMVELDAALDVVSASRRLLRAGLPVDACIAAGFFVFHLVILECSTLKELQGVVEVFLEFKVNVNAKDVFGSTALHALMTTGKNICSGPEAGFLGLVKLLLEAGADPALPWTRDGIFVTLPDDGGLDSGVGEDDIREPQRSTPIQFAAFHELLDVVEVMILHLRARTGAAGARRAVFEDKDIDGGTVDAAVERFCDPKSSLAVLVRGLM